MLLTIGWKLQKFHAHLHVAYNMLDFGCPMNWDTGVGESALAITIVDEYLDSCVLATPGITAQWQGAVGNRKGP